MMDQFLAVRLRRRNVIIAFWFSLTGLFILTATLVGYRYGSVKATIGANLKYTEQIDYLLKAVVRREQRGDAPAQILSDLRRVSTNYYCSYEGQPFVKLMEQFLGRQISDDELFYNAREGFVGSGAANKTRNVEQSGSPRMRR